MWGPLTMIDRPFEVLNIRKYKDIDDIQVVLYSHDQFYSTNLKQLVNQIIKESTNPAAQLNNDEVNHG